MKRNKLIPYLIIFALLGGTTACDKNEYIPQKTEYETFLLGQWKQTDDGYYDYQDGKQNLRPIESEYGEMMEFLDNGILHAYSYPAHYASAIYRVDADSAFLCLRWIQDGENVDSLREATDFTDYSSFVHRLTFINENKMRWDYAYGLQPYTMNPPTIKIYKRIK
ncbi:MAG: hypothetical protein LBQ65_03735 [Tannerellaceae bacterium]|jgi:hypothetical protein|nr:hypothetical protein [Tannerellaceae bacterium]